MCSGGIRRRSAHEPLRHMKTATKKDTLNALKELIGEIFLVDLEDIKPTSRLVDDLGADTVEADELFVAIEREWGIEISHEAAARLRTVRAIVDYIEEHTGADSE